MTYSASIALMNRRHRIPVHHVNSRMADTINDPFQDFYVDTASVINVNGGMVRVVLVAQNGRKLGENPTADDAIADQMEPKACLVMPIGGFLYMASLIKDVLADPTMTEQIERMQQAGILPRVEEAESQW